MLLPLILSACSDPGTATVLSGHSFAWQAFNHRLSHLSYRVDDAGGVTAAVVGGTSTTGQTANLAESCDPDTCQEFPFVDSAQLGANVTQLTAAGLISARGSATWVVGAAETTQPAQLQWEADPGEITVLVSGFSIDTSSSTSTCYNPAFGWLPRKISIAALADGPHAVLTASFEAGLSLEDERACLDEAAGDATVRLTVDVVAITGVEVRAVTVEQTAQYELGTASEPTVQPAPEGESIAGAIGWTAWKWNFHEADGELRGAYLRSLGATVDGETAASNYSPATQLSGFDYHFVGSAVSIQGDNESAEFSRVARSGEYTPTLDSAGVVVPMALE